MKKGPLKKEPSLKNLRKSEMWLSKTYSLIKD